MSPTFRYLLSSLLIAAVAPVGMAVLDLEQPAFAKNGNGNGGGNGGGHGGGNSGGNGGGHGNAGSHGKHAGVSDDGSTDGKAHKPAKAEIEASVGDDEDDDASLAPSALGKLNGVLHASAQAIAHASPNSPIGMAREFGEALGGFLSEPDAEEGGVPEEGDGTEAETDDVTVEDLGALMAGMTNKPVSPEQVQAVVDRLAADDPENELLQDLDPALAQDIADEANAIHGFDVAADDTDDDTGDDTPESEETIE